MNTALSLANGTSEYLRARGSCDVSSARDRMRTSAAHVTGWAIGLAAIMSFLIWLQKLGGAHDDANGSVNPMETQTHGEASAGATVRVTNCSLTCLPCDILFSTLDYDSNRSRVQVVKLQERGKPKSWATYMFEWAGDRLKHACEYQTKHFGDVSWRTELRSFGAIRVDLRLRSDE